MGCGGSKPADVIETAKAPSTEEPKPSAAAKDAAPEERPASLGRNVSVRASKMELSAEEKAMNGAPEGELFVVTVLPREALVTGTAEAFSPAEELKKVVLPHLTASLDTPWNEVFDALTSLRRILVYSPDVLTSSHIESLVPGIEKSIRNARSVLAKNAICCAEDLFLKCSAELNLSQQAVDTLSFALLDSCASNMPKMLRASAAAALEQSVRTGPLLKLVPALASRASHKNADVVENSMVFAEKAVAALGASSHTTWAKELDLGRVIPALNFGVNAKSAKAKKAAKALCAALASSMSVSAYEDAVAATAGLTPLQMEDLKAAAKKPAAAKKKADPAAADAERKKRLAQMKKQASAGK